MPSRARIFALLVTLAVAGVAACTLNPQPLPPGEEPSPSPPVFGSGGSSTSDQANAAPTVGGRAEDAGQAATDAGDAAAFGDGGVDAALDGAIADGGKG